MTQTHVANDLAGRLEVVHSLESFVKDQIEDLLKPVTQSWQPSSFLPDLAEKNWTEEVRQFREGAQAVSDELMAVLVGNMITEEALPSYQTWLSSLSGIRDRAAAAENGWAQWIRGWTAEENRHGDLLNRYLYLSGRVDMKAVETTIQYLIRNGFDPQTENDPYLGFVYTSFQERATKISHRNVAILATKAGDDNLRNICGLIAGEEAGHERAYTLFMAKIFEADPAGSVLAFAKMMKKKIAMPARLMNDGESNDLFDRFSVVAQRIGVYTAQDYASILEHLVQSWNVAQLTGLSAAAREAQDYLCGLPKRYMKLAERTMANLQTKKRKFSWVYNREV